MQPVTKERLTRYVSLKRENENRLERLARMKSDAEMPAQREPDGSQHTGSAGERMARSVERYMEYEDQIRPLISENEKEMAAIRAAVAALPDPMEREVLRLRYMDGDYCRMMKWREVALHIYGDDDAKDIIAVQRLHGAALASLNFV